MIEASRPVVLIDGIVLDYNAEGKIVGIEVPYISQRSPNSLQ
ncbi:MAG: DUF2283 domain-containing protein [Leptolyngbya sp. SIO1E4]|nr:DUF2283 domain-containing protein [Leptolyngbya sp. SIO1E4]